MEDRCKCLIRICEINITARPCTRPVHERDTRDALYHRKVLKVPCLLCIHVPIALRAKNAFNVSSCINRDHFPFSCDACKCESWNFPSTVPDVDIRSRCIATIKRVEGFTERFMGSIREFRGSSSTVYAFDDTEIQIESLYASLKAMHQVRDNKLGTKNVVYRVNVSRWSSRGWFQRTTAIHTCREVSPKTHSKTKRVGSSSRTMWPLLAGNY